MWIISADLMKTIGWKAGDHVIIRSCIAVGVSNMMNSLTFAPFRMFETFVLDRRYSLAQQVGFSAVYIRPFSFSAKILFVYMFIL